MPDAATPDPSMSNAAPSSPSGGPRTVRLPDDEGERRLAEAMRHMGQGALADRMGIEVLEVSAQRTIARMPVEGNTQPLGLLHGGASAVLAETIGSIASAMHAAPDRVPLGLELSCTHHRAMREGFVIGTAVPLTLGRTVATYDIRIVDEQQRPVCTARLTCLLRDR
jgi:uncharacterized protein (TIGR00369 family)